MLILAACLEEKAPPTRLLTTERDDDEEPQQEAAFSDNPGARFFKPESKKNSSYFTKCLLCQPKKHEDLRLQKLLI